MYRNSEMLETIMKKYNIKYNMKIEYQLITRILYNEKIELRDLLCMLEISGNTFYKLKMGMQKYTVLKFCQFRKVNPKVLKLEKIDIEMFEKLKHELYVKSYTLKRMLGISTYFYRKMISDESMKVPILDINKKHKVDLLRIDKKYEHNVGKYLTINELSECCKRRHITMDDFAKYYDSNPRYYKFNKIILEKSEKGFWISSDKIQIPDDFFIENGKDIIKRFYQIAYKISKQHNYNEDIDDFALEALEKIYYSAGNIVYKFYFDKKIIFNILGVEAKYIMKEYYKKNHHSEVYLDAYERRISEKMIGKKNVV